MEFLVVFYMIVTLLVLGVHGSESLSEYAPLSPDYYKQSCPLVEGIVRRSVETAVIKDPRMAASLLRLHFHDCFVMGCDGSILLDSHGEIVSEKGADQNLNSVRGFEVIDEIKYLLEEACPYTVSCADILAIAARDSVVLRGGPGWSVYLGRKDSLTASLVEANIFIPAPNFSLQSLISNFKLQGLDIADLVTLSGSHTFGKARCLNFRQRIYNLNKEEYHDRYKRYTPFRRILQSICPESGHDGRTAPLDVATPALFDNHYFVNLLEGKGLLGSDTVLVSQDYEGEIREMVWDYASNQHHFFDTYVKSIVKMGNINVITGNAGQVRKNCSAGYFERRPNTEEETDTHHLVSEPWSSRLLVWQTSSAKLSDIQIS